MSTTLLPSYKLVSNSSKNDTRQQSIPLDWEPYDRAAATLSFILFACIVLLNGAVIYTLQFRKIKKSRLHFYILHITIADFLVGFVNVLGDGVESCLGGVWYGGDPLCRIWRYSKIVLSVSSNSLLIGMSVDRFLVVKFPMKFVKIGNKFDKCLVAGAWILSAVFPLPVLMFAKQMGEFDVNYCELHPPDYLWMPYLWTVSVLVYILPTIVITASYAGICIVVWNKWRQGLRLSEMNKGAQEKMQNGKNKNAGLLPKAKIKSIKMTFVVCTAFFICWTPYFVFSLLDLHNKNTIDRRIYMIIGMMYPLNSACNPLIFILFNTRMFTIRKRQEQTTTTLTYDGRMTTQISEY